MDPAPSQGQSGQVKARGSQRVRDGASSRIKDLLPPPGDSNPRRRLHQLQNTLSAINLRVGVLAADPTCLWAQEENITSLRRIVAEAMSQAHELRAAVNEGAAPAPASRSGSLAAKAAKSAKASVSSPGRRRRRV
jgi:hypothetical protein